MTEAEMYLIAWKMIALVGFGVMGGAFLGVYLYCLFEKWVNKVIGEDEEVDNK